jgi:cell division protease FtsH
VVENYERAKSLLSANLKVLKALAEALLEREVLDAPEIEKIIGAAASA